MLQSLEHQEHAQHAAAHGSTHAALLVAVLAALLAIAEQQAKHADIKVEENAILAADAWNQYQAKSTRQLMSTDMARIVQALGATDDPAFTARRNDLARQFNEDAAHFAKDPKDGKDVVSERAREFERTRSETLEKAHSFDNAAASLELGIVLATASAITASRMLIRFAMLMGLIGLTLGVLGLTHPEWGAF